MNSDMSLQAKIISFHENSEEICASAARISTTKGSASDIFEHARNHPGNRDLIQKVLKSGHKSFIEHAVFTIAFCNVSAFVEQFLIECRLASFTIKSRRYVDFSDLGYYIPAELTAENRALYCKYMDAMFDAYQTLIRNEVPKEDARFLLPYSFHSHFYCTVNARELAHLIRAMKYGRGCRIPELQTLAGQLSGQLEALFPSLLSEMEQPAGGAAQPALRESGTEQPVSFLESREIGAVKLVDAPSNPLGKLELAHRIKNEAEPFDIGRLLQSDRPRELEQLSYTFLISDITLSGITHIVRHRMQSILIPSIETVNHNRYIIPPSVHGSRLEDYKRVLHAANAMVKEIRGNPQLRAYHYYYALSGNVMDMMTTVNARELRLFLELRACNRAQWEIRDISIAMLRQLREHEPALFRHFGPSCYTRGRCPEGRLNCGKMNQVVAAFERL